MIVVRLDTSWPAGSLAVGMLGLAFPFGYAVTEPAAWPFAVMLSTVVVVVVVHRGRGRGQRGEHMYRFGYSWVATLTVPGG